MDTVTNLEDVFMKVKSYVANRASNIARKPVEKRAEFCMSLCLVGLGIRYGPNYVD